MLKNYLYIFISSSNFLDKSLNVTNYIDYMIY